VFAVQSNANVTVVKAPDPLPADDDEDDDDAQAVAVVAAVATARARAIWGAVRRIEGFSPDRDCRVRVTGGAQIRQPTVRHEKRRRNARRCECPLEQDMTREVVFRLPE
jgi:hypothetical protein